MHWQRPRFTLFCLMIVVALCAIGLWVAAERSVDHSARRIWTLCHDPRAAKREKAIHEIVENLPRPDPKILVPVFIKALDDPSPEVRYTATIMLNCYRPLPEGCVKKLSRQLKDPDIRVCRISAYALQKILRDGTPDRLIAESALTAALDDRRVGVRLSAAFALIRIRKTDAVVPALLKIARESDVSRKSYAIELLRRADVDTPEVNAAFLQALTDPSDEVRAEAAIALLSTRESEALTVLREAIKTGIPAEKMRAQRVLTRHAAMAADAPETEPQDHPERSGAE